MMWILFWFERRFFVILLFILYRTKMRTHAEATFYSELIASFGYIRVGAVGNKLSTV